MNDKWDKRYLEVAKIISTWSKDPSTQVGAVAVGKVGEILATGYNGFSRGIQDLDTRLNDRAVKYDLIVHAEMNCIYNATYNGISLDGATLYIHGLPVCNECAKGVIQVGIKRVVMPHLVNIDERWQTSFAKTKQMFSECHIISDFI